MTSKKFLMKQWSKFLSKASANETNLGRGMIRPGFVSSQTIARQELLVLGQDQVRTRVIRTVWSQVPVQQNRMWRFAGRWNVGYRTSIAGLAWQEQSCSCSGCQKCHWNWWKSWAAARDRSWSSPIFCILRRHRCRYGQSGVVAASQGPLSRDHDQ